MAQRVAGSSRSTSRRRTAQASQDQRTLSCLIAEAQEDERRAIARELHNVLGQSLTVLKLILDKAAHSPPEAVGPSIIEAEEVVDEVVARIRDISLELLPSMLDDLGLLPTLLWYCQRTKEQTGVSINFKHTGLDRNFPPQVSTAAYRIVREAVTNATRHASVHDVTLQVWADHKTLYLRIEDHGAGFGPTEAPIGTSSGLLGMKERALSLGGKMTVDSAPGRGTGVAAELPLPKPRKQGG